MSKRKPVLIWNKANVGCYWNAESPGHRFNIRTSVTVENGRQVLTFPKSAYVLTDNYLEIGRFRSLRAAQAAAGRAGVTQ